MKKRRITLPLILVLILFVSIFCIMTGLKVYAANNNEETKNYKYQQSIHDKRDDGWIYVFQIYYPETKNDKKVYMFDGYNLKYKELENHYVPVIDKETQTEIDRIIPEYVTLSISNKYREDIKKIAEYFNEKQFSKKIVKEDLNDLNILEFDKDYLLEIFNKTIESPPKYEVGEYYDASFIDRVNMKSSDESLNGEWQLSYLIDFGYISEVNIEFISSNNEYVLSSNNNQNVFMYNNLSSEIDMIEKSIIENQSFNISNLKYSKNSNNISYRSDLTNLLSKAEELIK